MSIKTIKTIKTRNQTLKVLSSNKTILIVIKGVDYSRISLKKRIIKAWSIIKYGQTEGSVFISKEEAKSLGSCLLKIK